MTLAGEHLLERAMAMNEWPVIAIDGLKLLKSPLLGEANGLQHAFTTRHGGNSKPPLDSFNLGRHIADSGHRDDAMRNRTTLCRALRIDETRTVVPGQVHSSRVVVAEHCTGFADIDGIATNTIGTPILLHFADCVPVIIYDRKEQVICVVHAGWKGTAGSIAKNGVQLMMKEFGSQPANLIAAVGPAIGSCCYPTGDDVAERLAETVSGNGKLVARKEGKPYPELKAINAMQLLQSGVGQVDVSNLCTACHPEMFFSHRQSGGNTGRQGAIAALVAQS